MSVIAAGKSYGIAPKADLFLMKIKNGYYINNDAGISVASLQPLALEWCLQRVRQHIEGSWTETPMHDQS